MTNKGILSHSKKKTEWDGEEMRQGVEKRRGKHFESAAVGCISCLTLQKIAFPLFQKRNERNVQSFL